MPIRFTGIRLLLVFVGINLVMFLMLVTSMTSAHPWLARVLPGQFETGVNSSGYWVFFALVLLVDAVTVLIAGLALLVPALLDGATIEERRLTRHLVDRGGVSEGAKEAIFVAMREEAVAVYRQVVAGRTILFAGVVFLVFAFFAVSLGFARALPDGALYADATGPVRNAAVTAVDMERFTADQVAGAVLLNAPDIYGWHASALRSNTANGAYANFLFTFRAVFGFVVLLMLLSLLRRAQSPSREKKTIESVEAAIEEKKAA
ncbi:MAG: hypothetical protein KGJ79_08720 [Alphaproteobacteria bacterium]|nr:hypothetical protein [Alphaproteobacteria bacterium]MDE2496031.1 hypothetical protein [Alphaproteobacteria bacterium]